MSTKKPKAQKTSPNMHHLYPEHKKMVKAIAAREDEGISESEAVRRAIAFYFNHA